MPSREGVNQVLRPAAYCVIYDDVGRVLLTEWSRPELNPTVQGWTLPGGGMNFGEDPASAATREVFEETGLHVEIVSDPKVTSVYFAEGQLRPGSEFQALRFVYRARVVGGTFGIVEVGGSTTDIGWFTNDEVAALKISDNVAGSLAWFPPSQAIAIDHIQLAIPTGTEDRARRFWVDLIGLEEVEKPAALRARGGAHFQAGALSVHVGVEANVVPARKAHPAFRVRSLDDLAKRLAAAGYEVRWSDEVPDTRRFHTDDPFGNRLEFIA
jgi:8-oxo-dGTP pyrophosphatase MutT (NUDIX family)